MMRVVASWLVPDQYGSNLGSSLRPGLLRLKSIERP